MTGRNGRKGLTHGARRRIVAPPQQPFGIIFMRGFRVRRVAASAIVVAALAQTASPAFARPMTPAERRDMSFSGDMPTCDDSGILGKISSRFAAGESSFDSGLAITAFTQIVEVGYRSSGLDYYPRRFCMGRVALNDGKIRKITYAIGGSETGWLGIFGSGVQWCVEGLDRYLVYGAGCRAARP